jgi:16S rRNA (guanine966-N2)-methyltransferase
MRIIAGKYRGRRLVSFKADHIRPTTDRVKESVFNKLQAEWADAKVLDLFAGTGNLGFEALSRGAQSVLAVEMSGKSIEIIRRNIEELKIGREHRVVKDDVLKWLARYKGSPFDIVVADPPFTESLAHATLELLAKSDAVGPTTTVVVEASSHERVDASYPGLTCWDRRDYGDKQISFWIRPVDENSALESDTDANDTATGAESDTGSATDLDKNSNPRPERQSSRATGHHTPSDLARSTGHTSIEGIGRAPGGTGHATKDIGHVAVPADRSGDKMSLNASGNEREST